MSLRGSNTPLSSEEISSIAPGYGEEPVELILTPCASIAAGSRMVRMVTTRTMRGIISFLILGFTTWREKLLSDEIYIIQMYPGTMII